MRQAFVISVLLATHGLAILGGLALRGRPAEQGAVQAPPPPTASEEKLLLGRFIRPEITTGRSSSETQTEWEARIIAARQLLPDDADPASMVESMAAASDREYDSLQAEAAYLAWIERDVLAALRWRASWGGGDERLEGRFRTAPVIYLRDKGLAEVIRLRASAPEARGPLLRAAAQVAGEVGMQDLGKLAVALTEPGEVLWVLQAGFYYAGPQGAASLQGLAPYLPAIRRLLDDGRAYDLLSRLGERAEAACLREDLAAAGFDSRSLRIFDSKISSASRLKEQEAVPLAERIRTKMAEEHVLNAMLLQHAFAKEVPGYTDWCADFGDSRLSAAEVFSKLEAAVPGSAGIRGEMRELLFRELLPLDSAAAIHWLRGEAGWEGTLAKVLERPPYDVSPESLYRLGEGMPAGELESSSIRVVVARSYASWAKDDFESCMATVEKLPEGPLKEKILSECRMEHNWGRFYREAEERKNGQSR